MNKYSLGILMVFAFAKANYLTAQSQQTKTEQEERIEVNAFPAVALDQVQALTTVKKIKLYREFDGDKESFEAKFKSNGRRYSVEFSEDGTLEDVEIEVAKRKIPDPLWEIIEQNLEQIANRWRVERIQQQYLPPVNKKLLEQKIESGNFDALEMVVAFKEKRKIYRKELLIDQQGNIIKERDVKRVAYDFLLF